MGSESLSSAAEAEHSSTASTATTTTGSGDTRPRPPSTAQSLPVAAADEAPAQSSRFKGVVPQPNGRWGAQIYEGHARVWLGTFRDQDTAARAYDVASLRYRGSEAAANYPCTAESAEAELAFLAVHSKVEIVEMLRHHTYADELLQGLRRGRGMGARARPTPSWARAPLFEKAVTPSDVGKLNRLVVPKQQAEKHFPLKETTTGKGVLLKFEDGEGKAWRFRYSYWNSSQSYVLTKGWSRFVREKVLSAGDTVVFTCSAYGAEKQYFIDCKKSAPKVSRCADGGAVPMEATAEVEEVRVVKLFGVDIAGGKSGREAEQGPQEFFKRQCVAHGQHSPAIGAFVRYHLPSSS